MRIDLTRVSLDLPRGASLRLSDARGTRIVGGGGRRWLTEEGSAEDVFLRRGDAYVVRGDGRVVVGADEDAAVVVDASGHGGTRLALAS
jgi:hypothetical protein